MARVTGSTVRTVRFYEEAGLLEPMSRKCGGHRLFDRRALMRLQLILDLREAGLSLQGIKELFELKASCGSPEKASERMAEVLESQIDALQAKISKLRALREEFASTVSIIGECRSCDQVTFPASCDGCEVLERSDLPRAVRLLWE
ncbi:MAG: MerR family transcriptional regulator [Myxococcota bacterium]